jgi:hypothetical protein
MRGALVFLGVFIVVTLISIALPTIPPGPQIYDALGVPSIDYTLGGVQIRTLVGAVFNGVIYGIIVWIIYSIAERAMKKEKKPEVTEVTIKSQ